MAELAVKLGLPDPRGNSLNSYGQKVSPEVMDANALSKGKEVSQCTSHSYVSSRSFRSFCGAPAHLASTTTVPLPMSTKGSPEMEPTIISMSITFVKDQFSKEMVMELLAMMSNGQLVSKTVPVDGRILRLDAAFFASVITTGEEDAA